MTTNEIKQLQNEHARYRKALQALNEGRIHPDARRLIDCALNPPSLPVMLDELMAALKYYRELNGSHSVSFYQNESGCIRDGGERRVYSFLTLRQAVDFLNR